MKPHNTANIMTLISKLKLRVSRMNGPDSRIGDNTNLIYRYIITQDIDIVK